MLLGWNPLLSGFPILLLTLSSLASESKTDSLCALKARETCDNPLEAGSGDPNPATGTVAPIGSISWTLDDLRSSGLLLGDGLCVKYLDTSRNELMGREHARTGTV